ncbi:hypothetical protein L6452_23093 [Arctium lappa]|uniref:Uncharacterized protein n=1 Tax=Arctium lappa TaxID=4217 RepID=A0ACB9B1G8_ARCLA|nr:hypothetical protein L6452_23093 [Arctium lappa]
MIEGDRQEIDNYLQAIYEIQRSMESTTLSNDDEVADDRSKKVSSTIQIVVARLKDEFRNILISHATPIETESLTESISSTHLTSRTSSSIGEFPNTKNTSIRFSTRKSIKIKTNQQK